MSRCILSMSDHVYYQYTCIITSRIFIRFSYTRRYSLGLAPRVGTFWLHHMNYLPLTVTAKSITCRCKLRRKTYLLLVAMKEKLLCWVRSMDLGGFSPSIYQWKLYYNDIYYNHYNSINQVNLLWFPIPIPFYPCYFPSGIKQCSTTNCQAALLASCLARMRWGSLEVWIQVKQYGGFPKSRGVPLNHPLSYDFPL